MGIGNQRGTQMRAMLTGRLLKEGAGYRGVETAANCPHRGVSRDNRSLGGGNLHRVQEGQRG